MGIEKKGSEGDLLVVSKNRGHADEIYNARLSKGEYNFVMFSDQIPGQKNRIMTKFKIDILVIPEKADQFADNILG
jgi:hypothetical protein